MFQVPRLIRNVSPGLWLPGQSGSPGLNFANPLGRFGVCGGDCCGYDYSQHDYACECMYYIAGRTGDCTNGWTPVNDVYITLTIPNLTRGSSPYCGEAYCENLEGEYILDYWGSDCCSLWYSNQEYVCWRAGSGYVFYFVQAGFPSTQYQFPWVFPTYFWVKIRMYAHVWGNMHTEVRWRTEEPIYCEDVLEITSIPFYDVVNKTGADPELWCEITGADDITSFAFVEVE